MELLYYINMGAISWAGKENHVGTRFQGRGSRPILTIRSDYQ